MISVAVLLFPGADLKAQVKILAVTPDSELQDFIIFGAADLHKGERANCALHSRYMYPPPKPRPICRHYLTISVAFTFQGATSFPKVKQESEFFAPIGRIMSDLFVASKEVPDCSDASTWSGILENAKLPKCWTFLHVSALFCPSISSYAHPSLFPP